MERATVSPRREEGDGAAAREDLVRREKVRIEARKGAPHIADPAPLGLAAFAATTFVLSFFNADLIDENAEPIVFGLAIAYGGAVQVIAGIWEFAKGNTFGATAFLSYGGFWISLALFDIFFAEQVPDAAALGDGIGIYLVAWGVFTTYMLLAAWRTTAALVAVFGLLAATFWVLAIGEFTTSDTVVTAGGWVGIATALAAWYASAAIVVNNQFGRTVLPVRPLK